ncbi:cytochrome P450 [Penicillium citrinum]|uniref:Cytochrome P450 n=2 Tax=Penicillium TaxID=5073 RepID=A0A9W9NVA8_PENCI|nr:cytochrome P450 [Penicillium citrinum]KAJ5226687.1 cytochrome P450 [Penicillium citrinum]KAJ5568857.1 cytochrome P450 [Penicillium hetheringtonii]
MLLTTLSPSQGLITTFLVYWTGWIIYARFFHPLHNILGPFLSSISRAWLVYKSARGDMEYTQCALHKRYGHLARIAPNEISCSGPSEIKTVFYDAWGSNKVNKGYEGHFQSCDENSYTERRVLEPEDAISSCTQSLCDTMREFSRSKSKVDLAL